MLLEPARLPLRFRNAVLLRYFLASALALAADMAVYMLLVRFGVPAALAAVPGYAGGIVVHWLVSSRAVFAHGVAARGPARTRQKALFVGSALFGLALTTAVVGTADALGCDPLAAKLVAIATSFAFTWMLRETVVFPRSVLQ
jgi:putative flippase GtrA